MVLLLYRPISRRSIAEAKLQIASTLKRGAATRLLHRLVVGGLEIRVTITEGIGGLGAS